MHGQLLFVRRSEAGDAVAIENLHNGEPCTQADGFVGKLVGDVVAHAGMHAHDGIVEVDCLVVAPRMRRKRVGSMFVAEIAALVAPATLVVRSECPLREFFLATGFEETDGMLHRTSR